MWVPSSAMASTPTSTTSPGVLVPAAVTGSPGARVAACPLATVGVGCATSTTAVPEAGSTNTTSARCSVPSGMTAVTSVTPSTALADTTSCPVPSAAAVAERRSDRPVTTSCTSPSTAEVATADVTGAVTAAPIPSRGDRRRHGAHPDHGRGHVARRRLGEMGDVRGQDRARGTDHRGQDEGDPAPTRSGQERRAGRAAAGSPQLRRMAPPALLRGKVRIGPELVAVLGPVARLHDGAHYPGVPASGRRGRRGVDARGRSTSIDLRARARGWTRLAGTDRRGAADRRGLRVGRCDRTAAPSSSSPARSAITPRAGPGSRPHLRGLRGARPGPAGAHRRGAPAAVAGRGPGGPLASHRDAGADRVVGRSSPCRRRTGRRPSRPLASASTR